MGKRTQSAFPDKKALADFCFISKRGEVELTGDNEVSSCAELIGTLAPTAVSVGSPNQAVVHLGCGTFRSCTPRTNNNRFDSAELRPPRADPSRRTRLRVTVAKRIYSAPVFAYRTRVSLFFLFLSFFTF